MHRKILIINLVIMMSNLKCNRAVFEKKAFLKNDIFGSNFQVPFRKMGKIICLKLYKVGMFVINFLPSKLFGKIYPLRK